eukprot:67071_1
MDNIILNESENRKGWKEGTFCEIYCNSKKQWLHGLILRAFSEEKEECVEVAYGTMKKRIARFDKKIRPPMNTITDDEKRRLKERKVRYQWKEGSFCEAYYSPKKKWYKAVIQRVWTDDRGE